MEERGAIERLKRGDISGLEALVRAHQAQAVQAAYLILRDRAAAEDVAQNAFVRAYDRIGTFDSGRPFGPWFMRVVVNDAVKAARRERTVPFGSDDAPAAWLLDPDKGPQEMAEEAEQRERVWAALAKLPPAQRAAVVQRYYLGMSEAEMAREGEGSPPGTIGWRLHAARKALSRALRPWSRSQAAPATTGRTAGRPPSGPATHAPEGGKDRE
jgi:RNA polymerase sigma-70 factor (ECF subfamily)